MSQPEIDINEDDLHPDLIGSYVSLEMASEFGVWPGIYSKWIHSPMMIDVKWINEAYSLRRESAEKALKEGSIDKYLGIIEKPYRLSELLELHQNDRFDVVKHFEIFGWLWRSIENVHQIVEDENAALMELFDEIIERVPESTRFDSDVPLVEDKDGLITVYRGYNENYEPNGDGLCYTTSKEKAEWFAKRFSFGNENHPGRVRTRKVSRDWIVFTTDGRGEKEVVAL